MADLIEAGRWSLDDPIARHLPEGTVVPRQDDRQILVRDLLTHSAGLPRLPPDFKPAKRVTPHAELTEAEMLAALGRVRLTEPIGSKSVYSNFGMMIVSSAVARAWRAEGCRSGAGAQAAPVRPLADGPCLHRRSTLASARRSGTWSRAPSRHLAHGHQPGGHGHGACHARRHGELRPCPPGLDGHAAARPPAHDAAAPCAWLRHELGLGAVEGPHGADARRRHWWLQRAAGPVAGSAARRGRAGGYRHHRAGRSGRPGLVAAGP
ncbi:MAG: beta-lactamase family protein [Ideonella sp.]|nr:beta-lactamase family protein [Ideonella sp.]